jgi:hypothetical protein
MFTVRLQQWDKPVEGLVLLKQLPKAEIDVKCELKSERSGSASIICCKIKRKTEKKF